MAKQKQTGIDYLDTRHLSGSMGNRAFRASTVTLVAQGAKFVLQVASTVILARVLSPSDFGLVATSLILMGFVAMFADAGLSMATIQRQDITNEQVSALFWVNVAIGTLLSLLTAIGSPVIAVVYGVPELLWISLALSGMLLLTGLTAQHQAILRRSMSFSSLAIIDVMSMAAGIVCAIVIAVTTRSYWALVVMPLVTSSFKAIGSWWACGWIPSRPTRGAKIAGLLGFGGGLTLASFTTYASQSVDKVAVGYFFGQSPLGLYRAAYELVMLPVRLQHGPVASVMLPVLSRLRNDPPRFRHAYLMVVSTLALAGGPVVAVMYVEAEFLVLSVLGTQWQNSVELLRAFVPAAFMVTLYSAPRYLFVTSGNARLQVLSSLIDLGLAICAVLIGIAGGSVMVAACISFASVVGFVVAMTLAVRGSPVGFFDSMSRFVPHAIAVVASVVVAMQCRSLQFYPSVALLGFVFSSTAVICVYLVVISMFTSSRENLSEIVLLLRRSVILPGSMSGAATSDSKR
jgi:O-antigen/teichoic acid export membrane protein